MTAVDRADTAQSEADQSTPDEPVLRHLHVLVIGSGFAGLGLAIRLSQSGERDFLVVERGSEVGGTWRDNTYPGAACDVPSHLYSFSFNLNPNWSRSFSRQEEIQQYLRDTATKFGVLEHHLFGTEVLGSRWDALQSRWITRTSNGTFSSDVLVNASGALCEPSLPDIAGIESFRGDFFHSARWNHDISLDQRRVAIIGTGASAIQIVPEVARVAAQLDVYQRTAPWLLPRTDRPYSSREQAIFARVPGVQRALRAAIYAGRELFVVAMAKYPSLLKYPRGSAADHLNKQIDDPDLRARVTPTTEMGCKRILISNDYYPALTRENVELVTDPIVEIRPDAVVTRDGTVREVDVLVVATGFHATDPPIAELLIGSTGSSLADTWRSGGQQALHGTAVAGFPNLFLMVGPNTLVGHTSVVYMIESQINYVLAALATMRKRSMTTLEVRAEAQDEFNRRLQSTMQPTIWASGHCSSWYLDAQGVVTALWPDFTFRFRRNTRRFNLADYHSPTPGNGTLPRKTKIEA